VAIRVQNESTMLRFETESQLILLRSIIGSSSTIGLQKRRPKINLPEKIQFNDLFHLIVGNEEVEDPRRFRSTKSGVDFIYNKSYAILTARYEKHIYNDCIIFNNNRNGKLHNNRYMNYMMNGISETSNSTSITELDGNNSIVLNSFIKRVNDGVLKVSHFVDDNSRVVLIYVFPKEKRGQEIYENNFEKLKLEIQHYSS
jgi:hypothetical protein